MFIHLKSYRGKETKTIAFVHVSNKNQFMHKHECQN